MKGCLKEHPLETSFMLKLRELSNSKLNLNNSNSSSSNSLLSNSSSKTTKLQFKVSK